MTRVTDVAERYVADFKAFASNGAAGAPAMAEGDPRGGDRAVRGARLPLDEAGGVALHQHRADRRDGVRVEPPARGRRYHVGPVRGTPRHRPLRPRGLRGWRVRPRPFHHRAICPREVRAGSLAAALKTAPELARAHLAHYAPYQASPFAALNTAFLADGAFVHVPAGVQVDRPIELVFASRPRRGDPAVSHPRSLVIVERGAQATGRRRATSRSMTASTGRTR